MLILSRREAESICLGDDVVLTVVSVGNDKVRIGVQAPSGIRILRHELEVAKSPEPLSPSITSIGLGNESGQLALPANQQLVKPLASSPASSPLLLPCAPGIVPLSGTLSGPLAQHLRQASRRRAA